MKYPLSMVANMAGYIAKNKRNPPAAWQKTAARTADALDQSVPAQLAEQLLEIRQRDLLALGDGSQRHRTAHPVQGDVNHRGNGEASFRGEAHGDPARFPAALFYNTRTI